MDALNGVAHAAGLKEFSNTDEFEGKTLMIGVANKSYENKDGITCFYPEKVLFTHAPITAKKEVEFIANDFPNGEYDKEDAKKWFAEKIKAYKEPK